MEQYIEAKRPELAENERQELEIIRKYRPEQLAEQELEERIKQIAARLGAEDMKSFGRVMGEAMKDARGKADGAMVQQIVKRVLGGE